MNGIYKRRAIFQVVIILEKIVRLVLICRKLNQFLICFDPNNKQIIGKASFRAVAKFNESL